MSKDGFISSKEIAGLFPAEFIERLALWAHKRGCGAYGSSTPAFKDQHKALDVTWAEIHLCDVLNVLKPGEAVSRQGIVKAKP